MQSVVIIPGRAPHWVDDHARHLGQRLTETGRVMVVFTHGPSRRAMLPGRPGNGSVLGHSVAGQPIWTGRLRAGLGLRRSSKVTVIVLWADANHALALWAALAARRHHERVVLEIPQVETRRPSAPKRLVRRLLRTVAAEVVEGTMAACAADATRVITVLCGSDVAFAYLAMQTFEGMSDAAASRWAFVLQVDEGLREVVYAGTRRTGKVEILFGYPPLEALRRSDVLVADFDGEFSDLVHLAVLSGGAGVLVGQPVAGRVARCHDGIWLAQRNSASILVALEASSGDIFERPGSIADMRGLANAVIRIAEREAA
jgi:hypothetical protein